MKQLTEEQMYAVRQAIVVQAAKDFFDWYNNPKKVFEYESLVRDFHGNVLQSLLPNGLTGDEFLDMLISAYNRGQRDVPPLFL